MDQNGTKLTGKERGNSVIRRLNKYMKVPENFFKIFYDSSSSFKLNLRRLVEVKLSSFKFLGLSSFFFWCCTRSIAVFDSTNQMKSVSDFSSPLQFSLNGIHQKILGCN